MATLDSLHGAALALPTSTARPLGGLFGSPLGLPDRPSLGAGDLGAPPLLWFKGGDMIMVQVVLGANSSVPLQYRVRDSQGYVSGWITNGNDFERHYDASTSWEWLQIETPLGGTVGVEELHVGYGPDWMLVDATAFPNLRSLIVNQFAIGDIELGAAKRLASLSLYGSLPTAVHVDRLFLDLASRTAVENGTIDMAGAAWREPANRSAAASTARASLIGRGWTLSSC